MIFFLHGPDEYRAKITVEALKSKFRASVDPAGHNIHTLDEQSFTWEDFFSLLKSQGFLASKKMIIVKNILQHDEREDFEPQLLDWLKNQKDSAEENYVVFWQTALPKGNSSLVKKLKQYKYTYEFPLLDPIQLNQWLAAEAKKLQRSITAEAINKLVALVGNDTWLLHNELNKLAHAATDTIDAKLVDQQVSGELQQTIFDLVDACVEGNKGHAHQLIDQALASGAEPLYLLSMIIRQFRLLVQAETIAARTANSYALAESLHVHPFVAKKILSQVKKFSRTRLVAIYDELIAIDERLKYSSENTRGAFTLLIEKI